MTRQIRWRLAATYIIVMFVAMTILGSFISYSVERQFVSQVQTALGAHANLCRSQIEQRLTTNSVAGDLDGLCRLLSGKVNARIIVTGMGDAVIGDSERESGSSNAQSDMPISMKELRARFGCRICHSEITENQTYSVRLPVRNGDRMVGQVILSASLYNAKLAAGRTRRIILVAVVLTGLIVAFISMNVASTIAGPISHMNAMALKMAAGDLHQRVHVKLKDEVGQLAESLNVMADRLHDNMEQLAQDRHKMETMLFTMADGIVVTDRLGAITLFNRAAERLFGLGSDCVIGERAEALACIPGVSEMIRCVLGGDSPIPRDLTASVPAERIVHVYVAPVHDQEGKITGSLAVLQDVTEIRRQAEFRKDFVGNVSHELRTPIASVRAIVGAFQAGAIDDPSVSAQFLESLDSETERLSLLLNDLLALSALESGKLSPKRTMVIMREIALRAVEELSEKAKQCGVRVAVEIPAELKAFTDAHQTMQVILNLVDNAIKYSGDGGLVTITGEETDTNVRVSVKDTGYGIPPADLDRIFERFYRVDKARSRQRGGTGLGLSIVKDIMEAHGGIITVESKVGKGSIFTIVFRKAVNI